MDDNKLNKVATGPLTEDGLPLKTNDNHEEICFAGQNCPLCSVRNSLVETIAEKDEKIGKLDSDIENLESKFESKIKNLKDEISNSNTENERLAADVDRLNKDLQFTRDGRNDGQR